MNPEEGELRPQILDRFGLHAKAANLSDVKQRIEVIQRSDAFIQDPVAFCRKYAATQAAVRRRIATARARLPRVTIGEAGLNAIAKACHRLQVDGYRPDITIAKTARAFAALDGRVEVQAGDIVDAAELALSHRTRQGGTRPPAVPHEIRQVLQVTVARSAAPSLRARLAERLEPLRRLTTIPPRQALKSIAFTLVTLLSLVFLAYLCIQVFYVLINRPTVSPLSYEGILPAVLAAVLLYLLTARPRRAKETVRYLDFSRIVTDTDTMRQTVIGEDSDKPVRVSPSIEYTKKIGAVLQTGLKLFRGEASPGDAVPVDDAPRERPRRGRQYLAGKRAKVVTSAHQGRYVWAEPPREPPWDLALGPTIRAAAPHQRTRKPTRLAIAITPRDFRAKMREYRTPYSIVLLVDMSLSMVNSMINLGRAIFSFHRSVYRRRDRVGLVVFKGSDAFVLQQPTTNLNILTRKLMDVGASDFTPLAAGMLKAWQVLRLEKRRNRDATPMLVIISDGITNIRLDRALSSHTRRTFLSDAQADVVDVSRLLVREGIRTVVINTSHRPAEMLKRKEEARKVGLQWFTPTEFLMDLAQQTKGSYYGLASGGVTSPRVETTRLDSVFEYEGAAE
jgi:Mg-chelatase subunit ChlD